jgi:two-component system, OmpR family, sensor kinase
VLGDQARLGALLGNLVDNAVRHSPTGGEVTITVEVAVHEILARVQDQGPGVPAADRDRIFDRFVRLDTANLSDSEGLGLGLAISRAIATEHSGTLTCDDSTTGIGALFTLRLPAAQLGISA